MCFQVTNETDEAVKVIYSQNLETRHRITIPASETLTIRYASGVESQDGVTVEQIADYEEPEQDGPL